MAQNITITGTLTDITGSPNAGTVKFTLVNFGDVPPVVGGTGVIAATTTTAQAATDGTFSVALWANSQITPSGTYYQVETDAGTGAQSIVQAYQFLVGGTYDLSNLSPIVTAPASQPFIPIVANPVGQQTIAGALAVTSLAVTSTTLVTNLNADMVDGVHASALQPVSLLNYQATKTEMTGNGSAQVMYTYTLPGGTMAAGKGVRVLLGVRHTAGSASVTYMTTFGGNGIFTYGDSSSSSGGATGVMFSAEMLAMNNPGATNAQLLISEQVINQSGGVGTPFVASSGVDTTAPVVIAATFNVANTDKVIPVYFAVELV